MLTRHIGLVGIAALVLAAAGCGDDDSPGGGDGGAPLDSSVVRTDGSPPGTDGGVPPGTDAGPPGDAGPVVAPSATCDSPAPLVDTSGAGATVVGTGTPASCTEAALRTALAGAVSGNRVIRFDCGAAPHTITVTSELVLDAWAEGFDGTVVIDGGGTVTLDGGGTSRILHIRSSFERDQPHVTLERLTFTRGFTTDVDNTMSTDQGGAAVYRLGGTLTIIDSTFTDNQGPVTGQDVAGGAVYSIGVGLTTIVGSTFRNNRCASGGAIGCLHASLALVNSTVDSSTATGNGGNPGNGGNGGGIYMDGVGNTITLCGTRVTHNRGNAYGGGIFRVSNSGMPMTIVDRTTISDNEIVPDDFGLAGGAYLQGNVIEITASTFARNRANGAGGIFLGPRSTMDMTNTTVASNVAKSGLGGGLFVQDETTGTLLNCTLARNEAPGMVAFAGAIAGGGNLRLVNTIVAYSVAGNGWNPISCTRPQMDGGGNFQFPIMRSGGGSDSPDSMCAAGAMTTDPMIADLADNGGPTETILPLAGSAVLGAGSGCPAFDQRGMPRARCDSGAVSGP